MRRFIAVMLVWLLLALQIGTAHAQAIQPSVAGGWTRVAQYTTVLNDSTHTLTIPGGYTDLQIVIVGRTTASQLNENLAWQVNGLGTSIYSQQLMYANSTTAPAASEGLLLTALQLFGLAAGTELANYSGFLEVTIYNYAGTTFYKNGAVKANQTNSATTATTFVGESSFHIATTSAITSVTIATTVGASKFVAGTTMTAWVR